jgi:nucleoside-diphosphate-sugar epimerase
MRIWRIGFRIFLMDGSLCTLLTGSTGYLGSLVAAAFLLEETGALVLPVRTHHSPESVLARIGLELQAHGHTLTPALLDRITILPLPAPDQLEPLREACTRHQVASILHCAGCADYFNVYNLDAGNQQLTRALLRLGQQLEVERFVFVSTAFSSGFQDEIIPETLHDLPGPDPTPYTRSKRETEALVASSGLPTLIVRPSVVIGDSRDGRYTGKRYGIYQLWQAAERFLCSSEYVPVIYGVAPRSPLPLVHQDAFVAGLFGAYHHLPPGSILHLVSDGAALPTVRDAWEMWLDRCSRPRETHYYPSLADVPIDQLNPLQQLWVEFTAVNIDIASRPWHFETTGINRLRERGVSIPDVTRETVAICLERFIAESARLPRFLDRYRVERDVVRQVFEHAPAPAKDRTPA